MQLDRLTEEVKDLAERGQADIGLDYAWLDGVTVADWTRYHDLLTSTSMILALLLTVVVTVCIVQGPPTSLNWPVPFKMARTRLPRSTPSFLQFKSSRKKSRMS